MMFDSQNSTQSIFTVYGDSLTAGWMVRNGYLDWYRDEFRVQFPRAVLTINNRGVPGDTAAGGLMRMRRDRETAGSTMVGIQFGLNDAYMGATPGRYGDAIREMILQAKENDAAGVVVITSPWYPDPDIMNMVLPYYNRCEELAADYGVMLAAVHRLWETRVTAGIDQASLVQYDGVHPTENGYRVMADAVFSVLHPEVDPGKKKILK